MSRIVIDFENVHFHYRASRNEFSLKRFWKKKLVNNDVLSGVTFRICEGERVSFLGLNGAGKSTALKLIAGIMNPSEGQVLTFGEVGAILEMGLGFEGHLNAYQNILAYGAFQNERKQFTRSKIDRILLWADLIEVASRPINTYSTGMKARLAFAVSTEIRPEILLLDEVLGVGDVTFAKKARKRIDELTSRSSCMVLVTHDLNSARELTERAIWFKDGKVAFDGPVETAIELYYSWASDLQ